MIINTSSSKIEIFPQFDDPIFTIEQISNETKDLYNKLQHVGFTLEMCEEIAPITLEIKIWKKKRKAFILAHSYQTPEIIFGIADAKGDSYGLSKIAQKADAEVIVFCGVEFMAETAKILNPSKIVLLPSKEAGCSLSESITGEDVRKLKKQYPGVPVVTYINTSYEVKAESDVIVTSANAMQIIRKLNANEIIFLPDKLMAANLAQLIPEVKFITWNGKCIVHEAFSAENVYRFRKQFGNDLHILIHTECAPEVIELADLAGGTGDMIHYIKNHPEAKKIMLVTECGLTDRLKIEFPDREFVGSCNLCPYMKKINLYNILECLKKPTKNNIIEIPEEQRLRALKPIEKMFILTEQGKNN